MEIINVCNLLNLTVEDFKNRFSRGFSYAEEGIETTNSTVLDNDIKTAYLQAKGDFDCNLWFDIETTKEMFLLLSAFYLLQDFQMHDGLESSSYFLEASKSIGSVSVNNIINQKLLNSPIFSYYLENPFGKKYAIKLYQALFKTNRLFTGKPNLA